MLHERDAWWLVPLLSNLLLMAATIFAAPASFPHDSVSCVLVAALSSLIAFISVLGFVVHDIGAPKSFASLMGQTIILNVTYTVIYLYRGFDDLPMTFGQAFYFSTVTWTSLGYANRSPDEDIMLVTAFQAITGYVFLGLLISLLSNVVGQAAARRA